MRHLLVTSTILLVLHPLCAWACLDYVDDAPIKDALSENALVAATTAIVKDPNDLKSLEVILSFFGPEHVQLVWTSVFYQSKVRAKEDAYRVLRDYHSVAFLAKVLEQGSELAARWALLKIAHQSMNSVPESNGKHQARLLERGGLIDAEARQKLRDPILVALNVRSSPTRACALNVACEAKLVDQPSELAKTLLNDADGVIAAAAMGALAKDGRTQADPEVAAAVWRNLANGTDAAMLIQCCNYLRQTERRFRKWSDEEQGAVEKGARNPVVEVRRALAESLEYAATPENPRLIILLLNLIEDKDEGIRRTAILSLRHAKTEGVSAKLMEVFGGRQPTAVRVNAVEILGALGSENAAAIIAAARDSDARIREQAMPWLRAFHTPEAIAALEEGTKDPDEQVRKRADSELKWLRKWTRR